MKLKILGHGYNVLMKPVYFTNGVQGTHNNNTLEIEIDNMLKDTAQEEVLLHEIIEALNYRLELTLEHNKITALSEGLYHVLKDAGFLKINGLKVKK